MNRYGLMVVLFLSTSAGAAQTGVIPGENSDYLHLVQQGRAEYNSGHLAASERFFLAALNMLQVGDQAQRAAMLADLGDVYVSEDEVSKAEQAYSDSLATYKKLSDRSNTAILLRNLGATYSLEGRDDDALRILQEALKLTRTIPDPNAGLMAEVLNAFGMTYYRQGKINKAEALFNQALQTISASGFPYDTTELLTNLGAVYIAKHKFQKAEEVFKRALKVKEAEVGPGHPDLTFILVGLGVLYTDVGRYTDAEDQYQRALRILGPGKPEFDTRIARILHVISQTYSKAGRKSEAEAALAQSAVIARRNLNQHPDMATIVEDYSTMLSNQGRTKEAGELRAEAKHARLTTGFVINAHSPF
jgi:tetratricopeptide (TPR) repeat protein